MTHYQNQSGVISIQFDEHGNMIRQTDEAGFGSGLGNGTGTGVAIGHRDRWLHRDDGSSSSSSSEDEGTGIRKKGMMEQMKEKIPGVGHRDDRPQHASATTTPGGYGMFGGEGHYQKEHGHQKKGMMEKIKEKLPGQHGH